MPRYKLKLWCVTGALIVLALISLLDQMARGDEPPLHEHPTLKAMHAKSNELRQRVGLPPHRINAKLCQAAVDHSRWMSASGQMDHYANRGYQQRARDYGVAGFVMENIAYGQPSVESVMATWWASSGHHAAIVSNTTDAGFGYELSPSGQTWWVSVYGNDTGDPLQTVRELIPTNVQQQPAATYTSYRRGIFGRRR